MAYQSIVINQPVVNIYIQPEDDTEVDSQAIYGSAVEVIERLGEDWVKIKMVDGVQGWVHASQVTDHTFKEGDHLIFVKNLFAHVYRVNNTIPFPALFTIPYASRVKLETVEGERWLPMELFSGKKGWIQRGDLDFEPKVKTLEEMLAFSKKFLGLPYTWGGSSSYGFDCSGFVQMLFKEMNLLLPRNAIDQAGSDLFMEVTQELEAGDLLFFGAEKISHVGLYLGDDQFIHSGVTEEPKVMISNLQNSAYHLLAARRLKADPTPSEAHDI